MLENISYKFKNRNSKKNLKKEVKELERQLRELRHETIGGNRNGWISFGIGPTKDESLAQKIEDLHEYLGINYSEAKLAPKPKEDKK